MKKIKNKLTKSLSAILAFAILISGIIIPNKIVSAAPREIKVTNEGGGEGRGSDYFSSSDGYYIFCGEASLTPPVNPGETKKLTGWSEESNTTIRKIAYYGYASPQKWSGADNFDLYGTSAGHAPKGTNAYHLTHYALSNEWGTSSQYYTSSDVMQKFISFINKKPNAPSWFKVYSTKSGGSQRMFAWNFNKPKPNTMWLEVQKTNTEGELLDKVEFHVWYKGKNDGKKGSVQNPWKYITYDSNSMYTKGDGKKQEAYHGKFVDSFSDTKYTHVVVKEIKTLDGYILDEKEQEVKLVLDGYTPTKEHLTGQGTSHVLKFVNHKKTTPPPKKQNLSLLKTSANKTLTDIAKAGYSLEGAEYGVYDSIINANLNKNILGKLTTNESGKSNILNLDKGKYFVKELKAPKGFLLDEQTHEVDLTSKDQVLNVKDEPLFDPLDIMLKKQGDDNRPLEGAEFTVKYYDEILTSTQGKKPTRTWIFKTDENGYILFKEKYKISGDELFKDQYGVTLGLKGTYEFIETKAPKGYILDPTPVLAYVKENGATNPGTVYNMPIVKNTKETPKPQKAKFSITKIDSETNKGLKDVVFSLMKDNVEVKKLTTLDGGKVESGDLDFGTYTLREINVPKGYTQLPGDITIVIDGDETGNEYSTNIKVSGENQTLKGTNIEISNHSQKGKLILEKTAKVLTGISKDEQTGITKLEFTDTFLEDTTWNLIASEEIKSMDNQTVFYKKGDVVKTINTVKEKAVETNDIPLGKYILKEISTPKQFVLDKKEYEIEFTPQAKELKIHSITEKKYNERKDISFDLVKEFENSNLFTYKPKAEFGLFLKEEYRENGVIIPADTMLDKKIFEVTKDFETKEQTKKPKIVEIDKEITRYEISVFEEKQVDDKDKPIFSKDKENAEVIGYEQKTEKTLVDLIKVNTLEEKEAKTKELEEAGKVFDVKEIKETVKENVLSDTEKTSTNVTKFSVKGTFENILIDGKFYVKEISTDENYVIDNEKHEKEIDFTNVEEKHTTLPETKVINKLQKIKIEVVKTEEGDKTIPVQGARYKLVAVDPEKGETVVGIYTTDSKGKLSVTELPKGKYYLEEVSAPVGYFKSEGKVEIDTTNKSHGEKIVVEVENEKIPEIKTNATDKETGKKTVNPFNIIQIKDIVKYKDLIIGKEYNVKGVLMDKETNKPILDKKGKEVRAEKTFIAEKRNGEVELVFTLNADILRGKTTVVFEDLYKDGKLLVSHNDINDKDQTVKITNPEIKTKFTDIKGDKTISGNYKIKLVDNVKYKDLIIGNEYEVKMRVAIKGTNPIEFIKDENGNDLVVIKKFIADKKEGIIQIEVDLDLSTLKGKEIVAFEKIYQNGKLIASHEDINDKDQTIQIHAPAMPLTGSLKQHTNLVIGGLLLACGLILLNRKKN
ncbi:SpaA isopeptide-forming pilin-related protein [Helcococcus ovis]|uniref:SpaA isopeptide-forming pilin-related protein n=1 Tax=Helcococcus ovis TaxID=72026 RepID=UPI0038BC4E51